MTARHHPSEETLLAFAGGGLDEAYGVVVATHLADCPACRAGVLMAERIGGDLLDGLEAAALRPGARDACLARLDEPIAAEPASVPHPGLPASLAPYRIGPWRSPVRGIGLATILPAVTGRGHDRRAGLHLLRVAPGMALPSHGHGGLELTAVLGGAFEDDGGVFRVGDVAECDAAADHAPVALAGETCLCLIAIGGRLRFRHWLARLVQPWFGL